LSIIAISDTHFGLSSSTLRQAKRVDFLIWEMWRYGDGCEEIVLLGDILDLWRSRPEAAVRASRYFFQKLSELQMKISYVIGNHDHHLTVMTKESELMERIARGDLFSVYTPNLSWSQSINGLMMNMHYPTYSLRRKGRRYLFTHGHHLDGIQAHSFRLMKGMRKICGKEMTPADLEMMMAYTYEGIYRSSLFGGLVGLEEGLWKASRLFDRMGSGLVRDPVKRQYRSIDRFIKDRGLSPVDLFVYGDTHRAGAYRSRDGPLAMNAGCFARSNGRRLETPNTYIVISDDEICLREMGRRDPIRRLALPGR